MKIFKVLVLLLSIAGGSLVVWNASRDKETANKNQIEPEEMIGSSKSKATGLDFLEFDHLLEFDPDDMQVSSKSGPIMIPQNVAKIVEDESSEITVTDEEVKRTRDSMLSTSKSGKIMSDDKIREMLEERKKKKLMPSSKSIDAVLKPRDVENIIKESASDFIIPEEPKLPEQEAKE